MSEDHLFISIASGIAFFVQFVLLVGFVIVASVPVRRHRPDAWLPLFGAALVELLGTCINVVFWVLLLVALLKIAKPPAAGAPSYR